MILDNDGDGFKCKLVFQNIVFEDLLQIPDLLEPAVESLLVKVDMALEVLETLGLQQFWLG